MYPSVVFRICCWIEIDTCQGAGALIGVRFVHRGVELNCQIQQITGFVTQRSKKQRNLGQKRAKRKVSDIGLYDLVKK